MQNIEAMITRGEGPNLEFKSTVESAARIAKTLVAFANTAGGTLLVGVSDDKQILGVRSELHEMQKIEEASDRYCQPPLLVQYQTVLLYGKKVLVIGIPESAEKPHQVLDQQGTKAVYVRAGSESVPVGKQMTAILDTEPSDGQVMDPPYLKALEHYLQQNETITVGQFAKLLNLSERRASHLLHAMVRQQRLLLLETYQPVRFVWGGREG